MVREGNVGEILDDGAGNKLPGLLAIHWERVRAGRVGEAALVRKPLTCRNGIGARFGLGANYLGYCDRSVDFARHANRVVARTTDEKEEK